MPQMNFIQQRWVVFKILLENVHNQELIQTQEQSQLLFTLINAPVLSYDLIPD